MSRVWRPRPRHPGDRGGAIPRYTDEQVWAALRSEGYPRWGAITRAARRLGYSPHWLSVRLQAMREENRDED